MESGDVEPLRPREGSQSHIREERWKPVQSRVIHKTSYVAAYDNAYMTPNNAMVEALRGTQDPGYLRYQLGKFMILRLREDVRRKQGAAFDLGKFHDAFLAQGGVPIKLIRRAMLGIDSGPQL